MAQAQAPTDAPHRERPPLHVHLPHRTSSGSGSSQQQQQQQQQTVLARLQALFPPASPGGGATTPPAGVSRHGSDRSASSHRRKSSLNVPAPPPRALKVRIVTWNMHDSLPKGNLEELLGVVPPYIPPGEERPPGLPNLPLDDSHPYHLVVIAGQECPSLSGIPLGLGAGLKLKDKSKEEREKEKEKEKEKERQLELLAGHSPSGWTSILEDWFCNGNGAGGATIAVSESAPAHAGAQEVMRPPARSLSTGDIVTRVRKGVGGLQKGPYEMVAKERLMGIYLAVYAHRDLRPLVRGSSKSTVTAGLIGGRVGNKGGVGISLNVDGTTLLFVNAHLAAHGERVHDRLANLAKIKSELEVDTFLKPEDPRNLAEDLTDKFDYTFIFGDLNFRLDITRLHADWLISRQEYEQALAFDQLRNIMQNGHAFDGFHEAPINFPPTFKYDVLKTIKRSKKKGHSRVSSKDSAISRAVDELPEVEEKDGDDQDEHDADEEDERGDAESLAPSYWSSAMGSRKTAGDDESDEDAPPATPSRPAHSTGNLVQKLSIVTAAHKAKSKWKALISPSVASFTRHTHRSTDDPSRDSRSDEPRAASRASDNVSPPEVPSKANGVPPEVPGKVNGATPEVPSKPAGTPPEVPTKLDGYVQPRRSRPVSMKRALSVKSSRRSLEDEPEDPDRGVYDSSAKQRVPSWCDRILWKSTVRPPSEPEEDEALTGSARSRVGHFFSHLRSRASRRRESIGTISSTESSHKKDSPANLIPSPPNSDQEEHNGITLPFSRFLAQPQIDMKLRQTKSIETFQPQPGDRSPLPRSTSHEAVSHFFGSRSRRSTESALPRSKTIAAPTEDMTLMTGSADLSDSPGSETPPPVPPKDLIHSHIQSKWRFLPFLYRDAPNPTVQRPPTPTIEVPPPRPRKGDVVCLSYNTLDDRGMRRLEGRSDHRPVIGSYAIYI